MSISKYSQRFMDKHQLFEKYKKNVEWLHRNIPPDDIYDFAEQSYMAALFFLHTINHNLDLQQQLRDPVFKKWATNIISLLDVREKGVDASIDLQMDILDDE